MKIDIITALPELLTGFITGSILKIGADKGLLDLNIHNLRNWTLDRHKTVDDTPYGGGPGMIMKVEIFKKAIDSLRTENSVVIMTTPRGKVYNQEMAHDLSKKEHLIIICGHYKGIDARIDNYIDLKISVGDYILTGGEIPAAIITDSVSRLIPGVISDIDSAMSDSFENGLLDCSYFTRPPEFDGFVVPDVLMSGNHKEIDKWRKEDGLKQTKEYRPDLYEKYLNKNNEYKK